MTTSTYCTPIKGNNYLRLLHFARISGRLKREEYPETDKRAVVNVLNSLSEILLPGIRSIIPIIYNNIGVLELRDQLDPKVLKLLKDNTLMLVMADMINQHWLKQALALFKEEKIPVILLKGAAFAGSLYPADTPRVGVDLDLLVTEDDFEPACALLNKIMDPILLSSERVATHDTMFERVFTSRKGMRTTIEVHRGLTNPSIFNIDEQSLWTASRKHPAYNSDFVRILSPEDTLLHLAVHAFRDLDFCTHNTLDAHEVWCQWNPDSERLVERAVQWGARKVLFYLLANCKAIMETPFPETLLDNLKPTFVINGINKKILQSSILGDVNHVSFRHRLIQLTSQITFPDHIIRGLKFQIIYARTRMNDWSIARQSRQHSSTQSKVK